VAGVQRDRDDDRPRVVDPAAILALIGNLYAQIVTLQAENDRLRGAADLSDGGGPV
jgi:hypothetical protein